MEAPNNPDRELLFNIVSQNMPADLQFIIRQRRDANAIIHNAINQIVQDNLDDVDDVNPPPLIRERPRLTELDRIYNNIRILLGQPQEPQGPQGPLQQGPQGPPQGPPEGPPQGPPQGPLQAEDTGLSIEPYNMSSVDNDNHSRPRGGKLRKTSKKRPTRRGRSSKARKARRSRKSRKSRSTRRK